MNFDRIWNEWPDSDKFSGVFSVSSQDRVIFEKCCGYRNRSEKLPNNVNTAFGIASGTKLFTGSELVAVDKPCDSLLSCDA